MTEEELIEEISRSLIDTFDERNEAFVERYTKDIIFLVTKYNNNWITHNLADYIKDGRYIVLSDTDDGDYVSEMEVKDGVWLYQGSPTYTQTFYIEPKAYMSLPAPPEKDQ